MIRNKNVVVFRDRVENSNECNALVGTPTISDDIERKKISIRDCLYFQICFFGSVISKVSCTSRAKQS